MEFKYVKVYITDRPSGLGYGWRRLLVRVGRKVVVAYNPFTGKMRCIRKEQWDALPLCDITSDRQEIRSLLLSVKPTGRVPAFVKELLDEEQDQSESESS